MFEKHKKEAPFFTGITRGVGGAGFGKAAAVAAGPTRIIPLGSLANDAANPFNDGGSCIALWKLDNSTSNSVSGSYGLTSSGGTPVFTSQGTASDGTVKYFFDATPRDTKFNIANSHPGYPFSVSAWIWVPSSIGWGFGVSGQQKMIMNNNPGGQRVSTGLVDWNSDGTNEWTIMYGGTNHWTFVPTSRPTNEWIHVVFCVVGNNNSSHAVYQNGTSCSATNRGGNHGGSAGWNLGGNADNQSENAKYFIDQVRFFNKALSQSEAQNLYNNDRSFYNLNTAT